LGIFIHKKLQRFDGIRVVIEALVQPGYSKQCVVGVTCFRGDQIYALICIDHFQYFGAGLLRLRFFVENLVGLLCRIKGDRRLLQE